MCKFGEFSACLIEQVEQQDDAEDYLDAKDDVAIHAIGEYLLHAPDGTAHVRIENLSGK